MWNLLMTGGYTMIALLICSILAVAIIIEKIFVLKESNVLNPLLIDRMKNVHRASDINAAFKLSEDYPCPFSSIVQSILTNKEKTKSINEKETEFEGKLQRDALERGLSVLEVIAAIAPLLGLLGTVLGLVNVFHVMANVGVGRIAAFSNGISKALITTVAGLIIAIPSLIAYRYFSKKVSSLILRMEKEASVLINRLY